MKLKFKVQQYQTDAVESTVAVFDGQPFNDGASYRIDPGKSIDFEYTGFRNADIILDSDSIRTNIHGIQQENGIPWSGGKASPGAAPINLDIEMETGTGKTYVYIKTIFELNRRYGWSKFIIVVPSIAIREGVAESFAIMEDHFFDQYGKKIRWFIYNSDKLTDIESYSQDGNINVMIINNQAFASSMKEGAANKAALKIYSEQDNFASRKPIDVIAANHPIVILDEPQRLGGEATQKGIKRFNPLFTLNYSATHKVKHDTVYALDALDAYRQRLVKRISAIGHHVANPTPTAYMAIKEVSSKKNAIKAKIEILKKLAAGKVTFSTVEFSIGDALIKPAKLEVYDGYTISEINPERQTVSFTNGVVMKVGDVRGDDSYRSDLQREQIRSTIKAHFDKERDLFKRGIKCLSLIFVDYVSNYRKYDENGNAVKGELQKIFEEEYSRLVEKEYHAWDEEYNEYLRQQRPYQTHSGYFSIDKNKRFVNTESDKEGDSDDKEAYDRILKDKTWLLSMERDSPRFIFSHSALREGWDNPNVFQICMLRNSSNDMSRRQEVGRGLRVCVDKDGVRQDAELLGADFYEVNELTVIANESFADFSKGLQDEIEKTLRERPQKINDDYLNRFIGMKLPTDDGGKREVTPNDMKRFSLYLEDNDYINSVGEPTAEYRKASANNSLAPFDKKIEHFSKSFKRIVDAVLDKDALKELLKDITDKESTEVNHLNDNFIKEEFKSLWKEINHKYVYTVHYDSKQLVSNSIKSINEKLNIQKPLIIREKGSQTENLGLIRTVSEVGKDYGNSDMTYRVSSADIVGRVAAEARLTRQTVVNILKGLSQEKLDMLGWNPEQFIAQVAQFIRVEKATMIVDHIQYDPTDRTYDSKIFTLKTKGDVKKAIKTNKHISDYVFFDSDGEKKFAENLETASEVVVYAKLPRTFQIPTPVGAYAPDWAIAFEADGLKHIYFVAETKGTLDSMQLKQVELAKIKCAETLFNECSDANVRYEHVDSFDILRNRLQKYISQKVRK